MWSPKIHMLLNEIIFLVYCTNAVTEKLQWIKTANGDYIVNHGYSDSLLI